MASSLLDLPVDIIHLITPYLDAASYLSLCSTCKALHEPEFLHDSHYWSTLVRTTFRVPNQPVVQNDGKRWQRLCKRLLTQRRIYTWGNNEKACLGHSYDSSPMARPSMRRRRHISWPTEMAHTEDMGIVADMQCGGWSTTVLTAKGALYTVGVMDGLQVAQRRYPLQVSERRQPYMQVPKVQPTLLQYPPGFTPPAERNDPVTAIQQFSAGRAHVLGLSDSGRIWSWQNLDDPGFHIKFLHYDTIEHQSGKVKDGNVKKVVAGWNKSAAFIEGVGIVLWDPVQRGHNDTGIEDTYLIMESAVVPNTNFRQSKHAKNNTSSYNQASPADSSDAEMIGEVQNFVILEDVVLFNTHNGKAFVAQIFWNDDEQHIGNTVELPIQNSSNEETIDSDSSFVTDVQGSFHNFAVFTRSGAVLTSTQDRITRFLHPQTPSLGDMFQCIPALQSKGVISIAFGDYHYHALHSSGYITSYGNEPQACGALGLGGRGNPEGRLRGIRFQGLGGDGRLVPHAYTEGRRVWFEEEKRDWITYLTAGGVDPSEAAERMRMALGSPDVHCQGEVSEWVEQQGRDWEAKFGVPGDEDGLGAYFALSVSAAGWHSGALVLVNEELAAKVRDAVEEPDSIADEPVKEPTGNESPPTPTSYPTDPLSLLTLLVTTMMDYAQWFLGIGPYGVLTSPGRRRQRGGQRAVNANNAESLQAARVQEIQRLNRDYGSSPREGVRYIWANDHFPRLRLSNGVEMPGEVDFDEWRFERPEWDLEAGEQ